VTSIPIDGPNDTVTVAAAPFSGWYAIGDTYQDRVEVRDQNGILHRTITRQDILSLAPWMSLDGGPDGPSGLAFSASGRTLYILVSDDTVPSDGLPSDVLLRYDVSSDTLALQARLDLYNRGDMWPHLCAAHFNAYVYVGTGSGQIVAFLAHSAASGSSPAGTWTLPGASIVHGLAIDRDLGLMYAASDTAIYRATIPAAPNTTPTFTLLATGSDIRGLAWGDVYGGFAQRGLYILSGAGAGASRVDFIGPTAASTGTNVQTFPYTSVSGTWHSISATADGRLFVGSGENAAMLSDTSDTRLGFEAWKRDELSQETIFGRGLISPDGEPNGWVIDGDVLPGQSRFHPATPDGAAWTVLLLMMNEAVNGDAQAHADVSRVLVRYAGLAADGIKPVRNADGIFKHWLDPLTGNTKSGWADEYATLSTQLIVAAAARAMARYPDDSIIVRAASRIVFLTKNWDSYLQFGTDALAFKGLAGGGPDTSSWAAPFHEGILFAEQAGVYGGANAQTASAAWFMRSRWPTASYIAGSPITVGPGSPPQFQAAFVSLYPALLSAPYRADASPGGWRTQVSNLRWSNAAWTDDHAPRYYAVFSAGTSPSGYNADTLSNHPGNVTTFTSLMALSAFGDPAEAVGAYCAYRKSARQTFKTGASMLYRRSFDTTSTFVPNSAGLPDVGLGALGLAELIQPGVVDSLIAVAYPTREMCPQDLTGDGKVGIDDLYAAMASPTDLNGDGAINAADWACMENWLRRTELRDMASRQGR
jgi:hypothetical protein